MLKTIRGYHFFWNENEKKKIVRYFSGLFVSLDDKNPKSFWWIFKRRNYSYYYNNFWNKKKLFGKLFILIFNIIFLRCQLKQKTNLIKQKYEKRNSYKTYS